MFSSEINDFIVPMAVNSWSDFLKDKNELSGKWI
jgi:hypothetical protein